MTKKITRRKFLENSAKAGMGLGILSKFHLPSIQKLKGANDIINIGVVGLNGHGSWAHLEESYLKDARSPCNSICAILIWQFWTEKQGNFMTAMRKWKHMLIFESCLIIRI